MIMFGVGAESLYRKANIGCEVLKVTFDVYEKGETTPFLPALVQSM